MSESMNHEKWHGLGACNRISLVVFWLRASVIGLLLLLLLPVTHCNNWSGGYCNLITFPSNTDALWTPFRSSGSTSQIWTDENVEKSMRTGAAQTEEKTNEFGRHRGVQKSCRVHCRAYSGVFGSHPLHLLKVNRQMWGDLEWNVRNLQSVPHRKWWKRSSKRNVVRKCHIFAKK